MKSIIVVLSCLVGFSHFVEAKDYQYKWQRKYDHNIERRAPQTFLFNNKGQLIYFNTQFDMSLKKVFDRTTLVPNGDEIKRNLLVLLGETPDFSAHKYTLFYTVFADEPGECQPCDRYEKTLTAIKNKFVGRSISYNKISLVSG